MSCWNFAEAIYQFADSPMADRPALIHEDRVISYVQLRDRACGIASWMQQLALPAGAHVGHYLRNSNAYMETFVGTSLAGLGHVNVNYRYQEEELRQYRGEYRWRKGLHGGSRAGFSRPPGHL